jgi:hypothetical protein
MNLSCRFLERAMGIAPKNLILSVADSTPLASVTRAKNPVNDFPLFEERVRLRRRMAIRQSILEVGAV